MRDVAVVDAELRVVVLARAVFGGGVGLIDRLLDERLELADAAHPPCAELGGV